MSFVYEKGNPENYNFEKLMKEFKKRMETDNIIPEYKRRMYHEKPTEKKKRKRDAAKRRRMKKENKG